MPAYRPSAELVARLRGSGPLLILTGAGVSAESGLATFRGPGGHWEGRDPMSLATPEAFAADPELVWRFYAWRRREAAAAEPNPAHIAIAQLERERPGTTLVTQNVDGLHERAGSSPLRLHGSLWRLRCTAACGEREELAPLPDALPRCACGAALRPGVVWFGEGLPAGTLEQAERAAREADLVLVAGTSSIVYPAAALPDIARATGALLVEINPERTPLTPHADEHVGLPAGQVLPVLASCLHG